MTWTRLDDLWVDGTELAELSYEDRWHYLCLIQFCSRTQRYDGILRVADARRSSDLDNPDAALDRLVAIGLVHRQPDGRVKVGRIEEHIPPPSVREESENAKIRKRRSRLHKNGDHSTCLPKWCPHVAVNEATGEISTTSTRDVTGHVTRDTGTGQDGTGQASEGDVTTDETVTRDRTKHSPSEPCFTCGVRPAVSGSDCLECSSPASRVPTETRVSPGGDRIAPSRPAIAPDGGAPVAHRAPTVRTSCAYSGCTESSRPGKQMCAMHFTHEPSSSAA